jgi:hypothetical protein
VLRPAVACEQVLAAEAAAGDDFAGIDPPHTID